MADKKISQLTAAATLTGTELVPIVQSGNTVKTTSADIGKLPSSLTTTQIAFGNGSNLMTGSSGLTWDNGISLLTVTNGNTIFAVDGDNGFAYLDNTPHTAVFGINNAIPSVALDVVGDFKLTNGSEGAGKVLTSDVSGVATWATPTVGGDLLSTNNLSDVADATTSMNNILPNKIGNSLKVLRVNLDETGYELDTPIVELPTQVIGDAGKFLQADGAGAVSYQPVTGGGGVPYTSYVAKIYTDGFTIDTPNILYNDTGLTFGWNGGGMPPFSVIQTDILAVPSEKIVLFVLQDIDLTGNHIQSSSLFSGGPSACSIGITFISNTAIGFNIEIRVYP